MRLLGILAQQHPHNRKDGDAGEKQPALEICTHPESDEEEPTSAVRWGVGSLSVQSRFFLSS